ncbi:MAG: barstar family protein [Burkholderiales bacterium]
MSKLLQRLSDASKSGVYAAARAQDLIDAARGSRLQVARINLGGIADKGELMRTVAAALGFPAWFGANWDALEDCLTDLSWTGADGHVLLIEGEGALPVEDNGTFVDVLRAAAASWSGRGRPFFAVFVGGGPALPRLYRDRE